jgi:hypothetical protein
MLRVSENLSTGTLVLVSSINESCHVLGFSGMALVATVFIT